MKSIKMQEALFYTKTEKKTLTCELCPWFCELKPGQTGVCKVRQNVDGMLVTHVFDRVAALGTDPIEKKPLYHFFPGKNIFSIGEVGCNLRCAFCQNHHISQCQVDEFHGFLALTSEEILNVAEKTKNNIGVAYTYNEPFTYYEFMLETSKRIREAGLKNVVVSNGYINPEPLKKLLPFADAFNIDLKAFEEAFYKSFAKGKLAPVLKTLKIIATSNSHLEVTNLVISGLNDEEKKFEEMVKWIAGELGPRTPLHLSRYFPHYQLVIPPTPTEKLNQLYHLAAHHLDHVYLGNVYDGKRASTYCANCKALLIERNHYRTILAQQGFDGSCQVCKTPANIILA